MKAMTLQTLCKSFHTRPVIDHLCLQIEAGETFGLLGPSGAGKTTLLNIMSGLVAPDSGEVEIMGYQLPRDVCEVQRILGIVPQTITFYENLSAWDNLAVLADFSGVPHAKKHASICNVLKYMHLLQHKQSRVNTFSAEMKRRLALGCALLTDPPLLYLDELTAGIDVQERFALWDYVHSLHTLHKTCVIATSSFEEAYTLCNRIALIVAGKLLMIAVPEQFKQRYGDIVIEMGLSHPFTSFMELNALQSVKKSALHGLKLCIIVADSKVLPQIIALVTQECAIKELRVRALNLDEILAGFCTE